MVASKFPKAKQQQKNKNYIEGEFEEIKDD